MDTFYKMLTALDQVFKPSSEIIATSKEVKLVENTLHINEMDVLTLRNLRDFTVMFYSINKKDREINEEREIMTKVSVITCVIDNHIFNLGGEV